MFKNVAADVKRRILARSTLPPRYLGGCDSSDGVEDALVQWWYGHNAVAFFLTTPYLGLMYYFLPKAAERPVFSYRLSIVRFERSAAWRPRVCRRRGRNLRGRRFERGRIYGGVWPRHFANDFRHRPVGPIAPRGFASEISRRYTARRLGAGSAVNPARPVPGNSLPQSGFVFWPDERALSRALILAANHKPVNSHKEAQKAQNRSGALSRSQRSAIRCQSRMRNPMVPIE